MRSKLKRTAQHHPSRTRAFTLPEALLTLVILALTTFTLVAVLTRSLQESRQQGRILQARTAVSREMERTTYQKFVDVNSDTFPPTEDDGVTPIQGATGEVFVCPYNAATGSCTPAGDGTIKQVTVTVTLDSSRVFRLTSLLTDWTIQLSSATPNYYPPS